MEWVGLLSWRGGMLSSLEEAEKDEKRAEARCTRWPPENTLSKPDKRRAGSSTGEE